MGKKRKKSLKWAILLYMTPAMLTSVLGILVIAFGTNYVQEWYRDSHPHMEEGDRTSVEIKLEDGKYMVVPHHQQYFISSKDQVVYFLLSNAQVVLIPLWPLVCVSVMGALFYRLELREPIRQLMEASARIRDNQLDFQLVPQKHNEIWDLCEAFEEMRASLYRNNRELWLSLEERKRLNSAFSHDLRTPLTVLKGYVGFLRQYVPEGRISEEKLLSVLSMMDGQVTRLESYTQNMSALQKLEDIVPDIRRVPVQELSARLEETGRMLCTERDFRMQTTADTAQVCIDSELVMQVYENLVANAARYAAQRVSVVLHIAKDRLCIGVTDDGAGFSEEALRHASEPFFRDDKGTGTHFGLGLYICRILCEKCGGSLTITNHGGGAVTAEVFCGEIRRN